MLFQRRSFLLILPIILILVLENCSHFKSTHHQFIKLTNDTNQTLTFAAWETQASERVNISQRFEAAKSVNPLLQPGQSSMISVKDVNGDFGPGKSMKLFLYTVNDSMAYDSNNLTISYKDLSGENFKVKIRNDDLIPMGAPAFRGPPVIQK